LAIGSFHNTAIVRSYAWRPESDSFSKLDRFYSEIQVCRRAYLVFWQRWVFARKIPSKSRKIFAAPVINNSYQSPVDPTTLQPALNFGEPVAAFIRLLKEIKMSDEKIARNVVPIPDSPRTGLITYDAKDPDTKYPPIHQLRPPKGAPNVLVLLIDDVGFGASSAFGGPCQTPNAELLAAAGLKYNRFHTTALCSPTRQALLTGRNHHSVGMGGITEIASGAPPL